MFEDLIDEKKKPTKKKKKINLMGSPTGLSPSDRIVCIDFLEDLQEVLWDLEQAPCFHCGAETGSIHNDSCIYLRVLEEIEFQLTN